MIRNLDLIHSVDGGRRRPASSRAADRDHVEIENVMSHSIGAMSDWLDERQAQRLRRQYGPCGWLVSWQREGSGPWLARLSCPQWAETVERVGATRCAAISRADHALRAALRQAGGSSRHA